MTKKKWSIFWKKKTIDKFIDIDKNESPCGIRTRDLQIDTPNQYLTQC